MNKFFGKIIALFSGNSSSVTKDEEDRKIPTGCKCSHLHDQKIIYAQEMSLNDAFQEYAPCFGGYTYEKDENGAMRHKFSYEKGGRNIDFIINAKENDMFFKFACITCETCLGWNFRHNNYFGLSLGHSVESPKAEVLKMIKNKEDYFIKRADEIDLAKKICGIK